MPLHADPVRTIRADAELWETASVQPPFCAPWGDEPLPEISRALLDVIPAGTGWVHHFEDLSFRQAEYLLDPAAYRARPRTWQHREQTMSYRIVFGAEAFAEHATSGQGIPWRCSTATFLTTAVQQIDSLDVTAIRREFSVTGMDDLGLYKVDPDEDDDHAFTRVLNQLRAYGDHCRDVAAQDLDLIITLY